MRNSGPGLNVWSQSRRRINGRLIATEKDFGFPPFTHCDVLGACAPAVTTEWIETDDSMFPPALIFGESITFCDAGCGIISTMTSGQNPGEELLSRAEEIERVFQFLKNVNELGKEAGGWKVASLSDIQLRQIATDYVDVMRAVTANRGVNGYADLTELGQDVIDAFSRLTGSYGYDLQFTLNSYDAFLVRNDLGASQWPMINGNAVFGLSVEQAIPNSTLKNLLITGGIVAIVTLPLWGPPVVGALITGAKTAWAYISILGANAAGALQRTATVMNNIASRPYINSSLTVREIMMAGTPTRDAFLQNGLKWVVEGAFNGSPGIYELVIDANTQTIVHFLFKSLP